MSYRLVFLRVKNCMLSKYTIAYNLFSGTLLLTWDGFNPLFVSYNVVQMANEYSYRGF